MGKHKSKAKLKAKVTSVKAGSTHGGNTGGIFTAKVAMIAKAKSSNT